MHEVIEMFGRRFTVYDLSQRLSNSTSSFQPNSHHIDYMNADDTAALTGRLFGMGPEFWPDGKGYCVETVSLSTHSGTHLDAPYHYGPRPGGAPGRTIDAVPLRWCMGEGVLLDLRHKGAGEGIDRADVEAELRRIGRDLKPYDIVLVWTGTDRHFETAGYDDMHPGLRRDATEFLVDSGVRLIGIDAWGLDRPFEVMIEEAQAGDKAQLWESHLLGREKEYAQIEMLCNLDQLPRPYGFTVLALPVKLDSASAGWARVVALDEAE
ncbi:MAG TPA: cyclase family protein [Mycobacteriales bacterium]